MTKDDFMQIMFDSGRVYAHQAERLWAVIEAATAYVDADKIGDADPTDLYAAVEALRGGVEGE